jgi:putative aldouronate transport system permease protein
MVTANKSGNVPRKRSKWFKHPMLILFALPMVLYVFLFNYVPMFGIVIAFQDFKFNTGIFGSKWVGLKNFEMFLQVGNVGRLIRNTLGYNFAFIIVGTTCNVVLAFLLYEIHNHIAVKVYQTCMFIPYYLSWVSVAYIGVILLSYDKGVFNRIREFIGLDRVNYYYTAEKWPLIIVLINTWKGLAVSTALYYSALLGIDPSYREAALIEGAKGWQITLYINLPFLVPMLVILHIQAIGGIFNSDFGLFYQFTQNSAMLYKTTDVIDTYIYRALMEDTKYSMSSAANLVKSVISLVLIVTTNAIVRRIDKTLALF